MPARRAAAGGARRPMPSPPGATVPSGAAPRLRV